MSQENDQEKTEQPTAKKLRDARLDGNVAKSAEVSSVILMGMSVIAMSFTGDFAYEKFELLFETFFKDSWQSIDNQEEAIQHLTVALWQGLQVLMPLLTLMASVAVAVNASQTGMLFSTKILEMKGSRISPLSGIKRLVSVKGIVELVKGFSKIGIVGGIIYSTVEGEIQNITSMMIMPLGQILAQSGMYIYDIVTQILSALFVLSIGDAAYSRFQHLKDLRMTKQEIKDEFKQADGDPHMKSKRKQIAMNLLKRKRLDHAVLASDVVITNPTHYAVALHYDPDFNDAPIIRVKGMRNRALKIREFAKHYSVPIVENPPVARALYASAEEDEFVPEALYQAVAEILAYVYKNQKKKVA